MRTKACTVNNDIPFEYQCATFKKDRPKSGLFQERVKVIINHNSTFQCKYEALQM